MSNMSSPLSEIDRELIGELPNNSGATATMAKANGEPDTEAHAHHLGTAFTPLNATAGASVKISSNGDEVETGKVNKDTKMDTTEPALKTPKKRGAAASANDESAQPAKKRSPTKKAAAPSNVEVNTNGETTETTTPTVKKRASPKKKAVATPNADIKDSEMNGETEGPEPVTPPKKGKRASAKGKSKANDDSADTTDKSVSPTKGNGEIEGTTVHNTPRKRQAPKKELAAPRGIPNSWENADPADRLMVSMKEKGQSWTEIRATWKEVTGQDTAPSTLPNRYNRIKVNMMRMKDGDDAHLLAAKKEVEETYITTFWATVASNMERRGSDKYPAAFLQKTFKELEAAGKTAVDGAGNEEEEEEEEEEDGEGVKEEEDAAKDGDGDGDGET